jgi:RNA polymerase sigma-70 factor (sigma-E family)
MAVPDTGEIEPTARPREAVAALFGVYYSRLIGLAVVLTGDRALAEDLAQEAFARLWKGWDELRDEAAAPSYLRTTVANLARSALRRRRLMARERTLIDAADETDPAERIVVIRALGSLPYRQRVCVALRYYEGLTTEEVAQTLGISTGTVKSQTHKAMARLRRLLGGDS